MKTVKNVKSNKSNQKQLPRTSDGSKDVHLTTIIGTYHFTRFAAVLFCDTVG